jgi:hypothetical protein
MNSKTILLSTNEHSAGSHHSPREPHQVQTIEMMNLGHHRGVEPRSTLFSGVNEVYLRASQSHRNDMRLVIRKGAISSRLFLNKFKVWQEAGINV